MVADEADALCHGGMVVAEGATERAKVRNRRIGVRRTSLPVIGKAVLRNAVFRAQSPEKGGISRSRIAMFCGSVKGFSHLYRLGCGRVNSWAVFRFEANAVGRVPAVVGHRVPHSYSAVGVRR